MPLPIVFLGAATALSFLAGSQEEGRRELCRDRLGLGRRRPEKKPYRFETDCISADGESINDMRAVEHEVSYDTMLRHCDLLSWAREHGYEARSDQGWGGTLRTDPYVSYHRSIFRGMPCFYLVWSGIEFIWVKDDASPVATSGDTD